MIKAAGPNVFALGNVPHDWLFEHVSAVVHHGGAGTTAIGLRCGKPTVIVPFFGDQVRLLSFCFIVKYRAQRHERFSRGGPRRLRGEERVLRRCRQSS